MVKLRSSGPIAATTSHPDIAGLTVDRRGLFGLVGAAVVLTACHSSKAAPSTTTSARVRTAVVPSPTSSAPASSVAHIGGAEVPTGQALGLADANRLAPLVDGHWRGAWHDDAGRSGTSDVTIALNVARRTASATLAFTGDLLGAPVESQGYEIDLLAFMLRANQWQATSPQFGRVIIAPGGVGSASATATAIPAHPEITGIELTASRIGMRVELSYAMKQTDGKTVKGTMALSASGDRAVAPPLPAAGGAPNPSDIQSGVYAASLLTGQELTQLTGAKLPNPTTNGGRLEYAPGIDVSNAQSINHDLDVDLSIYVGHTAKLTAAFWRTWRTELTASPGVSGPWFGARWYAPGPTLYVYATPTRAMTVRVLNLKGTGTSAQATAAEHHAVAIATRLTKILRSGG